MYGIVTTANKWVFLRWTGSLEEPIIQISKDYDCSFTGKMEDAWLILSIIVRILMSTIRAMEPEPEEGTEEGMEVTKEGHDMEGRAIPKKRRLTAREKLFSNLNLRMGGSLA